jgi:hypothetical protein
MLHAAKQLCKATIKKYSLPLRKPCL